MTAASSPLISVIMPCYNAEKFIAATISQLYQQSFNNFELIVVDDGSTDNSLQTLNHLSSRYFNLRVLSQLNQGPASARNHGLKVAKGLYIAFLDSDDSWHPEFLSKLYQALTQSSDVVLAYCGWQNIGLSPNRSKPYIPPDYEKTNKLAHLLRVCPWPIHAVMTRKSAIDNVNGFDEKWFTSEDFDMWLRIAAFGKIVRVTEVLAYYHHHQGAQISVNKKRAAINHWRVQKAFLKDFPEITKALGKPNAIKLTDGELLEKAYESYWENDLEAAHYLFRKVLMSGHFGVSDLKYIFLTILPFNLYYALIKYLRK